MLYSLYIHRVIQHKVEEQKFSETPALAFEGSRVDEQSFDPSSSSLELKRRKVHGICRLREGYSLYVVPPEAEVEEHQCVGKARCISELSSNYNLPKALTAIF